MNDVVKDFRKYLYRVRCLNGEAIDSQVHQLGALMNQLNVQALDGLTPDAVVQASRHGRWEATPGGIAVRETGSGDYLKMMKSFFEFVDCRNYRSGVRFASLVPDVAPSGPMIEKLRPLNDVESARLEKFLVFHVATKPQRRVTALIFLLWKTGCSLDTALNLHTCDDGHFCYRSQELYQSAGLSGRESEIGPTNKFTLDETVDQNTVAFVNFYLENRGFESRWLFPAGPRSADGKIWKATAAEKAIREVFSAAELAVAPDIILPVLREKFSMAKRRHGSTPVADIGRLKNEILHDRAEILPALRQKAA